MIFKELETDQDWSEAIALRNIYNWTYPGTVEEARSFYDRMKHDRIDARIAGRIDDAMVLYMGVLINRNASDGTFWYSLSYDPGNSNATTIFSNGIVEAEKRIKGFGGLRSMYESRGEYPWEREILKDHGYVMDMKLPFSCAEVQESRFTYQTRVITFGKFLEMFPEDGLHQIWRLEMEIAADLPLPFPFVETPYEQYVNTLIGPENDLECKFLFFEDGEIKGLSQLWPSKVNPKLAVTGLTGVKRASRRKGVATQIKQHSIAWAKEQGIEKIFTDNEENNPMYQLNLQLGFRHLFDYEVYSKPC